MPQPLVTVITVVYNNYSLIESTIQSVLSQNSNQYEYVIIDGGSNDGTVEIINKYKHQLSSFISEPDHGIYHAMNKGINAANGDYCIFMNSGDYFCNENVISSFTPLLANHNYAIVYGDVITVGNDGNKNLKKSEAPGNKHRMYFCHQSAFAATDTLKQFTFDENYKMSADFKFFKQCFYAGCTFKYHPMPVAIFNLQGCSMTQRINGLKENIRIIKENDKALEKIRLLIRILPSYISKYMREKIKSMGRQIVFNSTTKATPME